MSLNYYNFIDNVRFLDDIVVFMNKNDYISYTALRRELKLTRNIKKYSNKIINYLLNNCIDFGVKYYKNELIIDLYNL